MEVSVVIIITAYFFIIQYRQKNLAKERTEGRAGKEDTARQKSREEQD